MFIGACYSRPIKIENNASDEIIILTGIARRHERRAQGRAYTFQLNLHFRTAPSDGFLKAREPERGGATDVVACREKRIIMTPRD